ncbi:endonuclease [Maribacter sp. 2308TA10-17]|uniref:endonuclease n=1 Tax=Maribacter sp. 2308TA10-17 TaxID=3386276 RepID=UPI0039BD7838
MKKKLFIYIFSFILSACSSSSGETLEPEIEPPVSFEKSVAEDDTFTAMEDQENIISNILNNDKVVNNARITSFDITTTEGGSIEDNRDGTYTYIPQKAFVGQDTFTYELCDAESTPNCSTATVTITVVDEGSPEATDDIVATIINTAIVIDDILANDVVIDDAIIFSVDDSSSLGSVVLNENGTITYTPSTDFVGQDGFSYTLCDDDQPEADCTIANIEVTVLNPIDFTIPTILGDYYDDLVLTTDFNLNYTEVSSHTKNNHTTILSYGQRHNFLYNADEDLSNPDNVTLMYSGESRYWEEYTSGTNSYSPQTFNTEHVYPQSRLRTEDAVTDLHHLRSTDAIINEERLNFPFIEGTGSYGLNGENWYPGDEWKGDVARMIFYLNVRYGETFDRVGTVELFLKWNVEDPVSSFEIQRNNVIQAAQGVRNPFIDNPYIATLIWGGVSAENKW